MNKVIIYNTFTRKKEVFKPLKDKEVGFYSCGPTVYWYATIGNLRTYVFNDILKRVLIYNGYKVKHVMNVTDVGHLTSDSDTGEDKIESAAKKEGKKAKDIAEFYLKAFQTDLKKLNIIEPTIWPKATEHIKEQIELIKKLEKKGYTYKTSDGIYFDTSEFKSYGRMAGLNPEKLEAGHRVSMREKKHATDFALWKFSENPSIRQQEWNPKDYGANWPVGFPGWHIECSAMSMKYLGEHFDIHTGGEDHIQVHHTNEIAQSEAATGKKFVNYWMHGAFLTFKGGKVSKSKGGLYTISELEEKFRPLSFRYFCLTTHYRKPLEFSLEKLKSAQRSYINLLRRISELKNNSRKSKEKIRTDLIEERKEHFTSLINDDLNIPSALDFLWNVLKDKELGENEKYKLATDFDNILGLSLEKESIYDIKLTEEQKAMIEKREQARAKKDWKTADVIREKLKKQGILIDDTPAGHVAWRE
ncbi:cysteine--tRNA ligase [Candidatus Pacearchaeota archaeon]|nr:cysteine--tRNA ligase [Candidatus Pacearchaeota archaeon]